MTISEADSKRKYMPESFRISGEVSEHEYEGFEFECRVKVTQTSWPHGVLAKRTGHGDTVIEAKLDTKRQIDDALGICTPNEAYNSF